MNIFRKKNSIIVSALLLLLLPGLFFAIKWPITDLKASTFNRLESIRMAKKKELICYFNEIHKAADQVANDEFIQICFSRLSSQSSSLHEVEFSLDRHFVTYYGDFYDILFVNASGYVFHSIRKESDYRTNLFTGDLANTKLVSQLKQNPERTFVEYEFYPPSGEPAAFFVAPAFRNQGQMGWFVLQCAVNQVNTILTSRENLGRSGEVYLVNQDRLMLSDSRFIEESTILKRKVNTKAVREAMGASVGQRLIEDYRGVRVFSSYEKFNIFETTWIIIAEIDESEVITEHYRSNQAEIQEEMLQYLQRVSSRSVPSKRLYTNAKRVDMNEYAKAGNNEILETYGVSTCTAIAILLPGKFAYLAHIAPSDLIYRKGFWQKLIKRKNGSDFLGEVIRRIKHYDVYPYQLLQLKFVIVAPHAGGFTYAVEKILDSGVDLKNICFMYDSNFQGANIFVDAKDGHVEVKWYSENATRWLSNKDVQNLATVYKKIIETALRDEFFFQILINESS